MLPHTVLSHFGGRGSRTLEGAHSCFSAHVVPWDEQMRGLAPVSAAGAPALVPACLRRVRRPGLSSPTPSKPGPHRLWPVTLGSSVNPAGPYVFICKMGEMILPLPRGEAETCELLRAEVGKLGQLQTGPSARLCNKVLAHRHPHSLVSCLWLLSRSDGSETGMRSPHLFHLALADTSAGRGLRAVPGLLCHLCTGGVRSWGLCGGCWGLGQAG